MPKYHSISYEESKLSLNELVKKFQAIPAETTDLSLVGAFCFQSDVGLALSMVLPLIPDKVTTISLGSNALWLLARLAVLFSKLRPGVSTLDLSYNELADMGADAFVELLKGFPATVTTLNLEVNRFEHLYGKDFAKIFAAIPSSVTTLKWGYIRYLYKQGDQFAVLQCLPKTLKTFLISEYDLDNFSLEELLQLKQVFPSWVKLQIDPNSPHCPVMQRINKLMGLPNSSDSPPTAATAAAKSGAAASVSLTQAASNAIAQKTGSPLYAQPATAAGVVEPSLKKEALPVISDLRVKLLLSFAKTHLYLTPAEMSRLFDAIKPLSALPAAPALDQSSDFKM